MINIKQFGDVHFNEFFLVDKLLKIEDALSDGKTNYIIFTGDLIHSNEFIRKNLTRRDMLLKWIERISSKSRFIMIPGNHDAFSEEKDTWIFDVDESFWEELASIDGVSFLPICKKYEDESIYVTGVDLGYNYYEKYPTYEDKDELLRRLKSIREELTSIDRNKLNILLSHSPVYIADDDVLKYIGGFNLVLSGHMHNGCVLPVMELFFPKNRGIISPKGNIFPKNARGVVNLNNQGSKLVITGGVSKIVKANSLFGKLYDLFSMEMTEIEYNPEDKKSTIKTLHL